MTQLLQRVRLGHSGAPLALSVKSLHHLNASITTTAKRLRSDAAAGTVAPHSILRSFEASQRDARTVKNALKSTARDLEDASAIMEGRNVAPTGPFSRSAADLFHIATALKGASSALVQAKSEASVEATLGRLKIAAAKTGEQIEAAQAKEDAAREEFVAAFLHAVVKSQPDARMRFSLSEAERLLGWNLPEDERELGKPDVSKYAPPGSIGRQCAVFLAMARTHAAALKHTGSIAKAAKKLKAPSKRDAFADDLATLEN